jgi:hypothetical protein
MTHRHDGPQGALQATAALVEEAREIAALKAAMVAAKQQQQQSQAAATHLSK